MTTRTATCQCGQLSATCRGEPARVSVCHCLDCQKRSGSSFAAQARFASDDVVFTGENSSWQRKGDDGGAITTHFCPTCGSTVWFTHDRQADLVAVAVGAFADPDFPAPAFSVYEERKHSWAQIAGEGIEHYD
ncbi:GFA family protein [Qipengyuania flava]|uniref:GFA family protein n=1 Tax=Qipengyuania flava TaxID=192812 RepID=UPI001C62A56F|nr:GFA family protein [Qipengyuania flava]QYJ07642.1 GFA family protein [Qipengyuania flava]